MSATPIRKEGKWIVSGSIIRNEQKDSEGNYKLSQEDRADLEFASGYLTSCDIPNRISFECKEFACLYFNSTLQERDELEQYMIEKKQEKILAKIKI